MKRWWQQWVALTSIRESGTTWAWFRIAVGVVLLYALGSMVAAGLVDDLWVHRDHGGMQPTIDDHYLVRLFGGRTATCAWSLVIGTALAAVAVTLGAGGRLSSFVALHGYYALSTAHPNLAGGYDRLITNALWLFVLAGASQTWSLDSWRRHGRWRVPTTIPAWPRYLAIFQLVVMYTCTGLNKLSSAWFPAGKFSALYWVFQEPTWRRFDMSFVSNASAYKITQFASAITWWWESCFGLLLVVYYLRHTSQRGGWLRRAANRFDLRVPFIAIGIAVHLGIWVLLDVGPFTPITLAYYVCFIPPAPPRGPRPTCPPPLAPETHDEPLPGDRPAPSGGSG